MPIQSFSEAVGLYQQGKSAEARSLCQRLLKREPRNPQILALHGATCAVLGLRDEAAASLKQALRFNPQHAPTHYMLGNVQRELAQPQPAVQSYQAALAHKPDFVEAWINLGLTHHESGNIEEAIVCYRHALSFSGQHPLALYNLGNALQLLGEHAEAVASYQQALSVWPNNPDIRFNLANALLASGQLLAAIAEYEQSVSLRPTHAAALANLAVAQRRLGRNRPALESLERALSLEPNNVAALLTKGNVLYEVGDAKAAIACLQRAVEIDSKNADAYFNLGNVLYLDKQLGEACFALERACELQPHSTAYMGSLIGAYRAAWKIDEASEIWSRLVRHWQDGQLVPTDVVMESTDDLNVQRQCAAQHARHISSKLSPATAALNVLHPKRSDGRFKIGYLSPDFGEHPVGLSIVEMLELHDKHRFEVIGLSLHQHPGRTRQRIEQACDQFIDLSRADIDLSIGMVKDLELDLLVDLAGYTAYSRPEILAARPALVQAAYLGFAGTSGAPWMDYLIADRYVIPEVLAAEYTEKIAWLDTSLFPTDTRLSVPETSKERQREGLPEDAFVFCCFNSAKRITSDVMLVWLKILLAVPKSVLWLQRANPAAVLNMTEFARQHGVDPARLVFARYAESRAEHLARHRMADMYLDTFPYNSHSTVRDALLMRVPVLTCSGMSFASRVAGTMLNTLGLPELIAADFDNYQRIAVAFAREPVLLTALRVRLAKQIDSSSLFDMVHLTHSLERSFAVMIERARSGQAAAYFRLSPTEVWLH